MSAAHERSRCMVSLSLTAVLSDVYGICARFSRVAAPDEDPLSILFIPHKYHRFEHKTANTSTPLKRFSITTSSDAGNTYKLAFEFYTIQVESNSNFNSKH